MVHWFKAMSDVSVHKAPSHECTVFFSSYLCVGILHTVMVLFPLVCGFWFGFIMVTPHINCISTCPSKSQRDVVHWLFMHVYKTVWEMLASLVWLLPSTTQSWKKTSLIPRPSPRWNKTICTFAIHRPFNEDVKNWIPVDVYTGGKEHGRLP